MIARNGRAGEEAHAPARRLHSRDLRRHPLAVFPEALAIFTPDGPVHAHIGGRAVRIRLFLR
jgi:hypothetical protein